MQVDDDDDAPPPKRSRPTVALRPNVGFETELKAVFAAKETAINAPRELFPVKPSEIVRMYALSAGQFVDAAAATMDTTS